MSKKRTNLINKNKSQKYLKIISKIESIRKNNNVNWMNILRIAFKHDAKITAKVMSKIYQDDQKISKLVKKLI
ncbi:hypothetical protein N9A46_06220 [Candidatus Pelagibacter ubique]|nr:hypothetical protein [Candidatus Pelagibacter ubique]